MFVRGLCCGVLTSEVFAVVFSAGGGGSAAFPPGRGAGEVPLEGVEGAKMRDLLEI